MSRVISYTRFSTRRQAAGDSYRRQTEAALKWCKEHGHELDTTLRLEDLGLSGYSGANAKRGALGVLQLMTLEGKLEAGTILVIEAFDRLTRLPLPDAYELLLSLINNGLTIVTLDDGKVWSKHTMSSLESFMLSLVTIYRGYQESEYKSQRLRETFAEHRRKGSQEAFGSAPGWLTRSDKSAPWQIIEERAESVRKVFELAAKGLGGKAIAKIANDEKWPVPTRLNLTGERWHAQMPGQLLRNRAVLGEHEHRIQTHEARAVHWRGRGTGIASVDYYPRIISDELWHRARAAVESRKVAPRRDRHYFNIFSGLMFCGHCGAPIQRKIERRGWSRAQLVCADKVAGATKCPTSAALQTDEHLLLAIFAEATEMLGSNETRKLEERIAVLDSQLKRLRDESERIADAIATTGGRVTALIRKAEQLQDELLNRALQRETLAVELALTATGSDELDVDWISDARDMLYEVSDAARDARASLHLRIARLVDTIWLFPYEVAMVRFKNGLMKPVPLPPKQLPSRAKPDAKYHKPPARKIKPQPLQLKALRGELELPEPRRSRPALQHKAAPLLYEPEASGVAQNGAGAAG